MLFPVGIIEVGITDGASAVNHHIVAHINTAVRNASHILAHCALEEHNVARLRLIHGHIPAQTAQALCAKPPGVIDAAVGEDIADKAGAIEAGLRIGAAPDIGITNVFVCFLHESGKGRIGVQRLLWNVIQHGIFQGGSMAAPEDALHVAVCAHV